MSEYYPTVYRQAVPILLRHLEQMSVFLKYSQQYRDDPLLFSNSLWRFQIACDVL